LRCKAIRLVISNLYYFFFLVKTWENSPNFNFLYLFLLHYTNETYSFGRCDLTLMCVSLWLLGNRSKHVQRWVGGSAPLVMTYQSDFYAQLSAIQFSFKVDELRGTIITLKQ